eukprot:CAMPEP_0172504892 /NCGR_PEP_ID=MMETSP1066-20121228/182080_1 /TAXON_ID=671091 /ORGANISM="Coscinodiscus wailesii, Strain CCMP2513" /LENGTH=650 /DNA_ID=CAMNT_0013281281 /DNA_START=167 /DNA_END=2119 /DNA_ORIENTATION=-
MGSNTIIIKGLGYELSFTFPADDAATTLSTLHDFIESETSLHPSYQRLIIQGKSCTDGTLPLNQLLPKPNSTTKAILMHSPEYRKDRYGMEKITKVIAELDALERKAPGREGKTAAAAARDGTNCNAPTIDKTVAQHLITNVCCQLDAIDVSDSKVLRDIRRTVLRRAENLETLWDTAVPPPGRETDGVVMDRIMKLSSELDVLERKVPPGGSGKTVTGETTGDGTMSQMAAQHLITNVCCQLDAIDVGGSEKLRETRRRILRKASDLEKLWVTSPTERGNDVVVTGEIMKLSSELDALERKAPGGKNNGIGEISKEAAQHLITDVCCQLDAIDVKGSEMLREIRRAVLRRAEDLEKLWDTAPAKRNIDREVLEKITKLNSKLDALEHDPPIKKVKAAYDANGDGTMSKMAAHHLIADVCCQLDAIDVSGSEALRETRQKVLSRASKLKKMCEPAPPKSNNDQVTMDKIMKLNFKLDNFERKAPGQKTTKGKTNGNGIIDKEAAQQSIAHVCSQLNEIDVGSSEKLRLFRQKVLRRASNLIKLWDTAAPKCSNDQGGMEKIMKLGLKLDDLERKAPGGKTSAERTHCNAKISKMAAHHLITDVCCQLDEIDVSGSEKLRETRRKLLRKASDLEKLWETPPEEMEIEVLES